MLAANRLNMPLQTRLPVASAAPRLLSQRLSVRPAVCMASGKRDNVEEQPQSSKLAAPFAAILAGALISQAILPQDALAAKSQGRVGGSSGFRQSRAAPRAAPQQSTTVNNTVIGAPAVAPPVYGYAPSPFGFGGFGGFSIMPTFVMPFPFFGGILQFFLLMMVVSVVFNVIRAIASSASNNNNNNGGNKKDDGWGDL